MPLKIPFTNFYIGTAKSLEPMRQAIIGGAYAGGSLSEFLANGGYRIDINTLYHLFRNNGDMCAAQRRINRATFRDGLKKSISFVDARNEERDMNNSESAAKVRSVLDSSFLSFRSAVNKWQRDRRVAGNHYFLILKNISDAVIGLQSIDPRTMAVICDVSGNVLYYKQEVNGHKKIFSVDEIIHTVFDESTEHPVLGVSPIESIVWDARAELASAKRNFYFYENNAVPSHLYVVKRTLTAENVAKLRDEVEKQFKGAEKSFKGGFLPYVEDIKTIVPSQKEMQYIESRKFTSRKVSVAMGVDMFLLGYTEGVQRSNGKIIERDFYENTTRPDEVYFGEEVLNKKLLKAMNIEDVKVKTVPSTYISESEIYTRSVVDVRAGIVTRNEARKMRGMPPSENELADELMIDNNLLDDLGQDLTTIQNAVTDKNLGRAKETKTLLNARNSERKSIL